MKKKKKQPVEELSHDEQQLNIIKHRVAQIAGHLINQMTYTKDGKDVQIGYAPALTEVVAIFKGQVAKEKELELKAAIAKTIN